MMEKRMLKKVSTVTAAGMMMTAMLGMQVSAAESSSAEAAVKKNPTITKQITKESNIYAPKTTFKFTVAPGTAVPASGCRIPRWGRTPSTSSCRWRRMKIGRASCRERV